MLVTPQWVHERLDTLSLLDASWHMPDAGRDAAAEFAAAHIPGAQRFDIDEIADKKSGLPHTLPSPEQFSAQVSALGIGDGADIVIYEAGAPFAAPRVWWMFRVMGHDAMLLDGGLAAWRSAGYAVDTGAARPPKHATFTADLQSHFYASADEVAGALLAGRQVLDVRSPERFAGTAPEPRPGVRAGHMPGAMNLHYAKLVDEAGRLKDDDALRAAFVAAGVDLHRDVVTTCGSGVTAAIATLALTKIGTQSAVFDGSWTEWGSDESRPIATGAAKNSA